jgi:hypothetical protein
MHSLLIRYAQYRPINMSSADLLWTHYVLFLCTRDPLCIVTRPVTFARAKHGTFKILGQNPGGYCVALSYCLQPVMHSLLTRYAQY